MISLISLSMADSATVTNTQHRSSARAEGRRVMIILITLVLSAIRSIDKKFARCGITRPNRSNFPISLSFLSPSSPPLLSFVFILISKLFCFLILVFDGPWGSIIMIINGSHHRIYDVSAQLHCSPAVVVIGIILTLVLRTTSKWEKKRLTSMSLVSLAFVNRLISNGPHMVLQSSATSILESPLPLAT